MSSKANYPEDLIPILLQQVFTVVGFPFFRHRIVPISKPDEKKKGYDASVRLRLSVFYMQFKKPTELSDESDKIEDRKQLKVYDESPLFFFNLHQDRKKKTHIQHNVLSVLSQKSKAAYVCPLFIDSETYRASIQSLMWETLVSNIFPFWMPFFVENGQVTIRALGESLNSISISDVPIFRHHVSIPPLPPVAVTDTGVHSYSFNTLGADVCFHNPKLIPEAQSLQGWLEQIYISSREQWFYPTDRERLSRVLEDMGPYGEGFHLPEEVSLETWQEFGDFLEIRYNIRQYAIVRREDRQG